MHVTVGQEGKYKRPPEQTLFGSDVILDFHGCFSFSLRHFYTLARLVFGHAVVQYDRFIAFFLRFWSQKMEDRIFSQRAHISLSPL